ncbi:MAG: hypothetical protein J5524_05705 [Bacteroidaceae bacterium]|nr:hypothetical protein [Bacteroidaceae bacterium]
MKKIFSVLVLLLLTCSAVHAQYMLKVKYTDGTHDLYQVDCTDDMEFEENTYAGISKVYMTVHGRLAGQNNTWGYGYPMDMIEEVSIVGTESTAPATEQSTFEVDEQTASVNMVNYSIAFGPCAIPGKKKLTVNRIDNYKVPESLEGGVNYMTVYDFDLEGIHDLKGVVEIRFPASQKCFAAYLNEETGNWDPVLSYFDAETKEMVIITDHLSTYSMFYVTDEHSRNAKLNYWGFDPLATTDIQKVAEKLTEVAKATDPNLAAIEAFANDDFAKYSLGLSVLMTPISVGGFDMKILNGYSDIIGRMGQAWSVMQIANAINNNDDATAATTATKLVFDMVVKPFLEKKIYGGNFLFPACMTAVAALDWQINWFGTTVHNTATTLYQNAYNVYFKPNSDYPSIGGYGYRTSEQWYDLIYPLLMDRNNDPDDVKEEIERLVTDYVNQPWRDNDGFTFAVADCRGWWPFWVEITDKDRREISDNHRKELYTGTLKSVIQNINRKYLCKTKEQFDKVYEEYAKMMNKVVNLRFKDSSVKEGGKSKFAGCKVRFKDLPADITDAAKWECTIKDDGTGIIQFRMYPYLTEGFKPELEVVDANDGKVGNIDIVGIQEVGRFYEASFDLSNGEVMALKDKWDITINPNRAAYETTDVSGNIYYFGPLVFDEAIKGQRGTVPGDLWGIYNGIVEAFEERTLNLDAEGNFSVNHKGLNMTGHYNSRTGSGTGKFTLHVKSEGRDIADESKAFDDWYQYSLWHLGGEQGPRPVFTAETLKDFDASFSVEGTFEISYSELMNTYAVHLDGIGSYNFNGTIYTGGGDTYFERNEDGVYVLKYHSKKMDVDNLYVNDGQLIFSPTLIYE